MREWTDGVFEGQTDQCGESLVRRLGCQWGCMGRALAGPEEFMFYPRGRAGKGCAATWTLRNTYLTEGSGGEERLEKDGVGVSIWGLEV